MKIIYDESKIQEIKQNKDKQNEELITTYENNYKKIIKTTGIVATISFLISVIGFYIAYLIIPKHSLSIPQIFLSAGILTIPLATFVISSLSHAEEKEFRRRDRENYEKKTDEFSYPASVEYNLFIQNKQLQSIVIIGNPYEKEDVYLDISANNTEGKLETMSLYDFEVSYSADCDDVVVDLMNSQVIYPLKDKTQTFEFCPTFNGTTKYIRN